ncbi:Trp operon repressor [Pasteurella testudinis DSM 23072]|uniref:Trp operon repressor homolog n=1 Tax=Pasteurella testudinis DSM 23072 TaxID=1122938 RepID=A0A1W1UXU1_9PAST|nr:trp operon repressor [Pasteurella testudinis]SMB85937.1 Trp operon repressor [Pasteurella testudinis DSM 23072]SUB51503.1 Trp operon repressor [Pasteurella testudinis]
MLNHYATGKSSSKQEQWNAFIELLRQAFADGREEQLLTLLLTADERDAVGLRVNIIGELLSKNLSQREIQQKLNTSAATITRGSNMLKTMPDDFLQWLLRR